MTDENNNNKEFLRLCEQMQQNQRWSMAKDCVITALTVIPTFYMIWQNHKKNRLTPKQRLMRNRAAQARLKLDEEHIMREAFHETELKKMETGLDLAESKIDLLSGLQKKGKSLLKEQLNQVNKVVDDQLKSATDKLKVDSLLNKEKKEK